MAKKPSKVPKDPTEWDQVKEGKGAMAGKKKPAKKC